MSPARPSPQVRRRDSVPFAAALTLAGALALPAHARAEGARADDARTDREEPSSAYIVAFRGMAGAGIGTHSLATNIQLQVDLWLTDYVGIGGQLGSAALVLGTWDYSFYGLAIVARTARRGNYGFLSVGGGYASGTYRSEWLCLDPCPAPVGVSGTTGDVAAGWLFHVAHFELGPTFVFQYAGFGPVSATFDLALGFAL
jgi:hypothetical protein